MFSCCIFAYMRSYTHKHHTKTYLPTYIPPPPIPTHLIVDSVKCVHDWCPLQYTRLASLTDLLQGCKAVTKSSTAIFTGGGRGWTLFVHARGPTVQTDRQTDRQTDKYVDGRQFYLTNIHTPHYKDSIVTSTLQPTNYLSLCLLLWTLYGLVHGAYTHTERQDEWLRCCWIIYTTSHNDPITIVRNCYTG